MGEGPQVTFTHGYRTFDLVVFHVLPYSFVGVELRGVWGEEEAESSLG